MTPDFIQAVATMRDLQKRYFAARRKNLPEASAILEQSKKAERVVDDMLQEMTTVPSQTGPDLFTSQNVVK